MTLLGSHSADLPSQIFDSKKLQRQFLLLWVIFLIFYFGELAHFSISIDDEVAILNHDPRGMASQDRWLTYLIERFVLSAPVLPFFPQFLFGALASLGYLIVARTHRYSLEDGRVLLIFILFSAFPTLFFVLDFAVITVSVGTGILLSCICLALFDRALQAFAAQETPRGGKLGLFAAQAVLGAVAIGSYQSLILLVAAGCCGIFLLRYLRGPAMSARQILSVHAYLAGSIAASVILGFLVARGFQWLLGIQPTYIAHFVKIDRLADSPLSVFAQVAKQYWSIYGGKPAVYGFRYITFPALLLLGMFALAAQAPQRKPGPILFVILYMLAITTVPFALNFITGGSLPYRALIAAPYVFWFFAAAAVLSPIPLVRRIGLALAIVVSLQCLYSFSTFQAQKRLVLDHDKLLASQLYERIVDAVPDFDRSKPYRVDFYGAHGFDNAYREIRGSTWHASFFEWDGGNPRRILAFMALLGYSNLVEVDEAERGALLPAMREMPVWPARGSVRVIDGAILVRLGQEPGRFHVRAAHAAGQP